MPLMPPFFPNLGFWLLLLVTLTLTHVTILSVTLWLHRACAHRSVVFHPALVIFFRCWIWFFTGMSSMEWAAVHRKHHAKCETAEDPHSPQFHGLMKVLFLGAFLYTKESNNPQTIERYGKGAPDDAMEHFFRKHHIIGLVVAAMILLSLFGTAGFWVWLAQVLWIPFWAAGVVNGVAHFWGYRNFETPDRSANLTNLAFFIGGEELHNNHHAFPASAKLSVRPWEFDWGWGVIRFLALLGLAKPKKLPPSFESLGSLSPLNQTFLMALSERRFAALMAFRKASTPFLRAKARMAGLNPRKFVAWFFSPSPAHEPHHAFFEDFARADTEISDLRRALRGLKNIWEASQASAEELLEHLRVWFAQAEKSRFLFIQRVSFQLRSFAY